MTQTMEQFSKSEKLEEQIRDNLKEFGVINV